MTPAPSHIGFRNWRRFQHYTDRQPPWVKLYATFHDETQHLSDSARFLALCLFVVAANKNNRFPNDAHWITVELGINAKTVRDGLAELLADGMLDDASKVASTDASATASKNASKVSSASRAPARSRRDRDRFTPSTTSGTTGQQPAQLPLLTILEHWMRNVGYLHTWPDVEVEITMREVDRREKISSDDMERLRSLWLDRQQAVTA
jgi:hypothetical protein